MSFQRLSRLAGLILVTALLVPDLARAAVPGRLTPALVFAHAAPLQKLIFLTLAASILATVAITAMKLAQARLSGGSAFISGLRLGGPLLGMLGAAYSALNSAIGVANVNPSNLNVLAPGIAESLLVLGLGVLAGFVAVVGYGVIDARIDRAILKPA
jgi:hypothetical protein